MLAQCDHPTPIEKLSKTISPFGSFIWRRPKACLSFVDTTAAGIILQILRVPTQLLRFFLCLPVAMIRRLTSRLSKDKKQEVNGNGVADAKNAVNGTRSSYGPKSKKEEPVDHSANRQEVESLFSKFAQLIHASQRPLPTQDDGADYDHTEPSGLLQDLKTIGFKDVNTLMQVMRNKATGELQDDKTYMMEHVMQVSPFDYERIELSSCNTNDSVSKMSITGP